MIKKLLGEDAMIDPVDPIDPVDQADQADQVNQMNQRLWKKTIRSFSNPVVAIFIGLLVFMLIPSCATQEIKKSKIAMERHKLAVMPFIKGKNPETIKQPLSCPFDQFCYQDDSIREGADKLLTGFLQEMLRKDLGDKAIPSAETKGVYEKIQLNHTTDTPRAAARRLGQALKADYIITGNVWRYKARIGRAFGVEKPASVAFALYLVEVNTGKTIWKGTYDKTQQSLTENLLGLPDFIKHGIKWLTVEELARFGMEKTIKKSPL